MTEYFPLTKAILTLIPFLMGMFLFFHWLSVGEFIGDTRGIDWVIWIMLSKMTHDEFYGDNKK